MAQRTCTVVEDGVICGRTDVRARGLCGMHYQRERNRELRGPDWVDRRFRGGVRPPCSDEGCDSSAMIKGLCMRHYQSRRSHEYRKANPERLLAKHLNRYGLTLAEYYELLAKQDGRCAICQRRAEELPQRLAVDHDWQTGRVRGLLCVNCNSGIGQLADDPQRVARALRYLQQGGTPGANGMGHGVTPSLSRGARRLPRQGGQRKKTHCQRGHEFTPENIQWGKDGKRRCLTCAQNRERERLKQLGTLRSKRKMSMETLW